ncbi:MAG: hypothetical protein NT105_10950 [Verrucomicrobia bacterium]|nr:hypothetical protein [Verrucomicrobiota bacterium]
MTAVLFYVMFLDKLLIVEDVNMEAMDMPLTVAHLERAREKGVSAHNYFNADPIWNNLKQENPHGAFAYFGKRFQFEFFAFQAPLLSALYVPFVKLAGVGAKTVALYSTFFAWLAWMLMGLLAWQMFGRWCALLAMLLLISSLGWLIHTKIAYTAWMPSAVMVNALALAGCLYLQRPRHWPLVVMGCLVGGMYMVGWVVHVFGSLMVGLMIVIGGPRHIRKTATDVGVAVVAAAGAIFAVTAAYALYHHSTFAEIHTTIWAALFGRFSQGSVPGHELSLAGKLAYAFRCMFVDMRTMDHMDKCLEGHPAVPLLFSVLFGLGLLYSIKQRSAGDKVLLIWLVSVFGVLGSFLTFTHRYALLALPAMSIVAARGVAGIAGDLWRWQGRLARAAFGVGVAVLLALTLAQTHRWFYVDYMLNKPPVFEVDRMRGHASLADWLSKTGSSRDTLVVLGDPIMFPHTSFLFDTFGQNYRFMYWSNRFRTDSTPVQVQEWEQKQLTEHRRIVYAFSTVLLGDSQTGTITNDWRPFLAAHTGLRPAWTYSYAGRPPSILVFEVSRSQ